MIAGERDLKVKLPIHCAFVLVFAVLLKFLSSKNPVKNRSLNIYIGGYIPITCKFYMSI